MEFIQMASSKATAKPNERVETQTEQELAREGRGAELKKRLIAKPELATKVDDVRVCTRARTHWPAVWPHPVALGGVGQTTGTVSTAALHSHGYTRY